jgi:hypothetical protein
MATGADPGVVQDRHVDDAQDRLAALCQGNERAEGRTAGHEGTGPVQGIQNPDEFRITPFGAEFLADDPVGRECLGDGMAQRRFAFAVGLGHRAFVTLGDDVEPRPVVALENGPADLHEIARHRQEFRWRRRRGGRMSHGNRPYCGRAMGASA